MYVTVCELSRQRSVICEYRTVGSCSVVWQEHTKQHSPGASPQSEVSLSFVIQISVSVSTIQVTY